MSANGPHATEWTHNFFDADSVDITSDQPGNDWTWAEVNALTAKASAGSIHPDHPRSWSSDVHIDAFLIEVTYEEMGMFKTPRGATFAMDEVGNEYHLTYKDKSKVVFDANGRLLSKEDLNGNELSFEYDPLGRLSIMRDGLGQDVTFSYTDPVSNDRVTMIQDHLGRACYYAYSNGTNLVRYTDLEGNESSYEYLEGQSVISLNHNLSRMISPEGNDIRVIYYDQRTNTEDKVCTYFNGLSNEVKYVYADNTTYSTIPGTDSFQAVDFNSERDLIRIYIREGELLLDTTDGGRLIFERQANAMVDIAGQWGDSPKATGAADSTLTYNVDMQPGEDLKARFDSFTDPGYTNWIAKVILAMRGVSSNDVYLSAGGSNGLAWSQSTLDWVEVDITTDKDPWTGPI